MAVLSPAQIKVMREIDAYNRGGVGGAWEEPAQERVYAALERRALIEYRAVKYGATGGYYLTAAGREALSKTS